MLLAWLSLRLIWSDGRGRGWGGWGVQARKGFRTAGSFCLRSTGFLQRFVSRLWSSCLCFCPQVFPLWLWQCQWASPEPEVTAQPASELTYLLNYRLHHFHFLINVPYMSLFYLCLLLKFYKKGFNTTLVCCTNCSQELIDFALISLNRLII